ncbi:MAG: response regulator transcription factor [Acidobacteriia bacterium]|nr:response regulator transcription factor [Terriglobia bacterium]
MRGGAPFRESSDRYGQTPASAILDIVGGVRPGSDTLLNRAAESVFYSVEGSEITRKMFMGLAQVLLATDSSELWQEMADFLTREGFEFLGTAGDEDSLVEAALLLDPDVIVVDLSILGMSGIRAVRELKRTGCRAKVVFLTESVDEELISMAQAAGGMAFVARSRGNLDLVVAMRAALGDGTFLSRTEV